MTLKQAFTIWSSAPKNTPLAVRSRDAVQRVLMKKWNDIDLEQFSELFCRRIFYQSTESLEMKIKAASVLVYLLQWGAGQGHCQYPPFTLSIASEEHKRACKDRGEEIDDEPRLNRVVVSTLADVKARVTGTAKPEEPMVKEKPEALARRKAELKARKEPKGKKKMEEKKTRGKQPKPVVQIDPETLQVIKEWPSMAEAESQLGIYHVDKAVTKLRKAGGFYWSLAADADTFRQRIDEKTQEEERKQKEQAAMMREKKAEKEHKPKGKSLVDMFYDEQQLFEQMKRDRNIPLTRPENTPVPADTTGDGNNRNAARDALEVFTDEELMAELDRRGWKGELQRVQKVTIGSGE